jgi:hypothetical protein
MIHFRKLIILQKSAQIIENSQRRCFGNFCHKKIGQYS